MTKICSKCEKEQDSSEFYKGCAACKECVRRRVQSRYEREREKISQYERRRNQTDRRRSLVLQYQRDHRANEPEKYKARNAVNNAVRDGRLKRMPCEVCGSPEVQAHHHDYSKPLDVRWLCFTHHREIEHGQTVVSQAA